MKAAVIQQAGAIPQYADFAEPVSSEGMQTVTVLASAIKNIDKMLVAGSHYAHHYKTWPAVAGTDGVGVLPDGTRVYAGAAAPYGMMAAQALISNRFFVPVPDSLDAVTAAALPNPGVSAWLALEWRGKIKSGDTVFILGATGVTGQLAVQLARHLGAGKIIAAGRNEAVLQTLPQLGATELVSLSQPAHALRQQLAGILQQQPPDIVIDYLWGEPAEQLLEALTGHDLQAEGHITRYIQAGEMAGSHIRLAAAILRSTGIELLGMGGGSMPKEVMASIPTEIIPKLFALAASHTIRITTETVALVDIAAAWQRSDTSGKRMVVVPGEDAGLRFNV